MRKGFVPTENYRRLAEAQRQVEKRGAAEAGLVIVRGPFGVGKSQIVNRWAVDNGAIFIRAKETWSVRALLDEMARVIGVERKGSNSEVQARVIGHLAVHMNNLVFDEADHLIRSTATLLEVIRDITDLTGVACFLVVMDGFSAKLALPRYGHIASRVARVVDFEPLSEADVQAAVTAMCEVKLTPELVKLLHQQSAGKMRLVLNAISTLEQWAAANGLREVGAEHIKGKSLCIEFKPGQHGRRS